MADLVEHVSVWLPGLIEADHLIATLEFPADLVDRVRGYRRLFAVFWLLMLLPGNPADSRNPSGSVEKQAERLLTLLGSG